MKSRCGAIVLDVVGEQGGGRWITLPGRVFYKYIISEGKKSVLG